MNAHRLVESYGKRFLTSVEMAGYRCNYNSTNIYSDLPLLGKCPE